MSQKNFMSYGDAETIFTELGSKLIPQFVGTQADWNLLSTAEKKKYKQAIFTDDYDDNPVGNLNALTTTDKSSCVGAINEVNNNLKPSSAVLLQANSIPGITIAWENNEDKSHMAYRVGNLVIINVSCFVTGTYSGESTWDNLFEMPSSLLKSGEQFMDSIPVSITASVTNGNGIDDNRILRGRQMKLTQNQSFDFHFGYQIIVGVVSQ